MVQYRPIAGYRGYIVGDDGSVWSRRPPNGVGPLVDKPRRLTGGLNNGYVGVLLRNDRGGRDTRLVHRLVLEAFVGECPPGMEACHFPDRDRSNNRLDNLRWDTRVSNQADKAIHGTVFHPGGEKHGMKKISEVDAIQIRSLYASGSAIQMELADRFGVSKQQISKIVRGERWSHLQSQGA